mmetsp:Transcript_904/g.3539  ORF Transcript_904/g.3539 Transcript_904/m.3539 type:complete len:415 (-) Transcript_904:610-1854(-)
MRARQRRTRHACVAIGSALVAHVESDRCRRRAAEGCAHRGIHDVAHLEVLEAGCRLAGRDRAPLGSGQADGQLALIEVHAGHLGAHGRTALKDLGGLLRRKQAELRAVCQSAHAAEELDEDAEGLHVSHHARVARPHHRALQRNQRLHRIAHQRAARGEHELVGGGVRHEHAPRHPLALGKLARARGRAGLVRRVRGVEQWAEARNGVGDSHDHASLLDGLHGALDCHTGSTVAYGEERLRDHALTQRERRQAVSGTLREHARLDALTHAEGLLELVDVLIRAVGHVHVPRRPRIGAVLPRAEVEQQAHSRIHARHARLCKERTRPRQVAQLDASGAPCAPRDQLLAQRQPHCLLQRVDEQHPRRDRVALAVLALANVEPVDRAGEVRHEAHVQPVGQHRLDGGLNQVSRLQRL